MKKKYTRMLNRILAGFLAFVMVCGAALGNLGSVSVSAETESGTEDNDVNPDTDSTVHTHSLTYTAEVAATRTTSGNTEYWYCSGCQKYYSDSNATTEITQASTVTTYTVGSYVLTILTSGTETTAGGSVTLGASMTADGETMGDSEYSVTYATDNSQATVSGTTLSIADTYYNGTVTVTATATVDGSTVATATTAITVKTTRELTVSVVDYAGSALAATVTVTGTGAGTVSGSEGSYTATVLAGEVYTVTAAQDGYVSASETVAAGTDAASVTLTLNADGTFAFGVSNLTGTITADQSTAQMVAGSTMTLTATFSGSLDPEQTWTWADGYDSVVSVTAISGSTNSYAIEAVGAGEATVTVSGGGVTEATYTIYVNEDVATDVTVLRTVDDDTADEPYTEELYTEDDPVSADPLDDLDVYLVFNKTTSESPVQSGDVTWSLTRTTTDDEGNTTTETLLSEQTTAIGSVEGVDGITYAAVLSLTDLLAEQEIKIAIGTYELTYSLEAVQKEHEAVSGSYTFAVTAAEGQEIDENFTVGGVDTSGEADTTYGKNLTVAFAATVYGTTEDITNADNWSVDLTGYLLASVKASLTDDAEYDADGDEIAALHTVNVNVTVTAAAAGSTNSVSVTYVGAPEVDGVAYYAEPSATLISDYTIAPAEVSVSTVTYNNGESWAYDGTNAAHVTEITLTGILDIDDDGTDDDVAVSNLTELVLDSTYAGTRYLNTDADDGGVELTLSGADAANYTISQEVSQTTLTAATIDQAEITIDLSDLELSIPYYSEELADADALYVYLLEQIAEQVDDYSDIIKGFVDGEANELAAVIEENSYLPYLKVASSSEGGYSFVEQTSAVSENYVILAYAAEGSTPTDVTTSGYSLSNYTYIYDEEQNVKVGSFAIEDDEESEPTRSEDGESGDYTLTGDNLYIDEDGTVWIMPGTELTVNAVYSDENAAKYTDAVVTGTEAATVTAKDSETGTTVTFTFSLVKSSANTASASVSESYTLDGTAPSAVITITAGKTQDSQSRTFTSAILSAITFGFFGNGENTSFAAEAADFESGLKSLGYYIASADELYDTLAAYVSEESDETGTSETEITSLLAALTYTDYESSVSLTDEDSYIIIVRAEDNVGNVTYTTSNGIVIDVTTPSAVTLSYADSSYETYGDENLPVFAKDVTINVTATDAGLSGIESITAAVTVNDIEVDADEVLSQEDSAISDGVLYTADQESRSAEDLTSDATVNTSFVVDADTITEYGSSDAADVNTVVVTVTATDRSGNTTSSAITFYVDQNDPEVTIESDVTYSKTVNGVYYFDAVRTITVTVTEATFDEADAIATFTNGADVTTGSWSHDGSVHTISYTFGVEANETDEDYTFAFAVQDQGGNSYASADDSTVEASIPAFTVDMKAAGITTSYVKAEDTNTQSFPVGETEDGRTYADGTVTATIEIEERNFDEEGLTITVQDRDTGEDADAESYSIEEFWTEPEEDGSYVYSKIVTFFADCNYVVTYSYTDLAGNDSESGPEYFTVDTESPTGTVEWNTNIWAELLETITFGLFSAESTSLTVTATDETAGVASFCYYISDYSTDDTLTASDLEDVIWMSVAGVTLPVDGGDEVTGTVTLETMNQTYVVYTMIEDQSGNITYLSSDGVVLDGEEEMEIEFTLLTESGNVDEVYDGDVNVSITVTDPDTEDNGGYSGLASVTWEINDGLTGVTQSGSFDLTDEEIATTDEYDRVTSATDEITINSSLNNTNTVSVTVTATDNAGNTYSETLEDIMIDITQPTIEITFDNNDPENDSYYDADRTATIVVTERNFSADNFVLTITNTDDAIPALSEWTTEEGTGNGDDTTYTATVTFSDDGDYTLSADFTDLAGNAADTVTVEDFTIDQTAPVVTVEYNLNEDDDYEDGYFNATRTATITVTEHNFSEDLLNEEAEEGADGILITITPENELEAAYEDAQISEWTTDEEDSDVHTLTITYSGDAEYTFDVSYTDLAGNTSEDYEEDSFVIDQTLPVMTVSYQEANGDEAASDINVGNTEEDRYFADDTVTATLVINEHNFDEDGLVVTVNGTEITSETELSDDVGIAISEWVQDEEDTDVYSLTITYSGDSNYIVTYSYTDLAGNEATSEDYGTDYFTVDTVNPTGTVKWDEANIWEKLLEAITFGLYSKEVTSLTVTATDATAGVREFYYYISEYDAEGLLAASDLEALDAASWTSVAGITLPVGEGVEVSGTVELTDMNQTYVVYTKIVDQSGWVTYLCSDGIILDDTEPEADPDRSNVSESGISITDTEGDAFDTDTVYPEDVEVMISVIDPDEEDNNGYSGLAEVTWEINDGLNGVTQSGSFDLTDEDQTTTDDYGQIASAYDVITISSELNNTNTISVTVTATDNAGNVYTETLSGIQIDTTEPTIEITFDNNDAENGFYYDADRTATIVVTERNFNEDDFVLTITNTDGTIPTLSSWTTVAGTGNGDDTTHTATVTFSADGDYTLSADFTDLAGNAADTATVDDFTIDQTDPVITVTYDLNNSSTYYDATRTATITVEEHNFRASDFVVTYTAANTGANYTAPTAGSWSTSGDTHTLTYTFSGDALYTFGLDYADLAGNEAAHYQATDFTVDKTQPTGTVTESIGNNTWSARFSGISFDLFSNTTETVTITATDVTAGVAEIAYSIQTAEVSTSALNTLSWTGVTKNAGANETVGTTVNLPTMNRRYVVYVRLTDKSGNVTYLNSNGMILDSTKPTISFSGFSSDIIYNGNVTVNVAVTDPDPNNNGGNSGVDTVTYTVYSSGTATQTGTLGTSGGTVTINSSLNNTNYVTVEVTATDKAGNTITETSNNIQIDITTPTITITYDTNAASNGTYYNTNRTATIVVTERNFDSSQFVLNITNTDGSIPSLSGWSTSGSGDATTHTATVTFSADGDYTVSAYVTDMAGNLSETVKTDDFTVDQTDPTVNVSYSSTSTSSSTYFNSTRTATITITEHNFDASNVNIALTASLDGSTISVPAVVGWSTSGDTHTATITYNYDGDFTFDISFTDLAGNILADYAGDSFTIDLVAPTVEITGVENESANKGTVAPIITISDVNFDASAVTITLTGANSGTVDVTGMASVSNTGNGVIYTFSDFADGMDDIYTLTATATDLAGNQYSASITFSVNRDGSTYSLSTYTKDLISKSVTNDPQNLVITEINVNALTDYTITYTLNGSSRTLVEGEDYEVEVTGGNGGWYKYVYTIYASVFEEEGEYSITITSVDEAENTTSNKVKETVISFTVDKTGPVIAVSNLENNGRYTETSHDYSVSVKDNVAVDTVEIYIDEELTAAYTAEDLEENDNLLDLSIASSNSYQAVSIVAYDTAGNESATDNYRVLVTANQFVQFVANKTLLYSVIAIILLLILLAAYIIWRTNKKRKEAANGGK